MAPSITVWPTADANAYQAVATIDTYHDNSLHGAPWRGLSADDKTRTSITATRQLDRERWAGAITAHVAGLAFPRTGIVDREGAAVADDVIPPEILDAHSELCNELAANPGVQTGSTGDNVKAIGASKSRVEFFEKVDSGGQFPIIVQDLISHMLAQNSRNKAGAAYGTDATDDASQFQDRAAYDKTHPYG